MRRSTRYVHLPDLQMERDELAATERSNAKILRKYAHYELLVVDEWLTEGVDDKDISLLFEPIERRYAAESTMPCTQYTPAEWHGRLGGGVQADAMVDRLVHESARIDLGDVNVRKLLAEKAIAIRNARNRRYGNGVSADTQTAKRAVLTPRNNHAACWHFPDLACSWLAHASGEPAAS